MATNNLHDQTGSRNPSPGLESDLLACFRALPPKIQPREMRSLRRMCAAHRVPASFAMEATPCN